MEPGHVRLQLVHLRTQSVLGALSLSELRQMHSSLSRQQWNPHLVLYLLPDYVKGVLGWHCGCLGSVVLLLLCAVLSACCLPPWFRSQQRYKVCMRLKRCEERN